MSISIRRNQYSAVVQPFVPSRCFSRPSLRHRGRFENLLPFLLLLDTSELGSFSMEEPRPMPPEQQGAYFSGSLHSPLSMTGRPLVVYEPRYPHYRFEDNMGPLYAPFRLFAVATKAISDRWWQWRKGKLTCSIHRISRPVVAGKLAQTD